MWSETVVRNADRCIKLKQRVAIRLMQHPGFSDFWYLANWSVHLCLGKAWDFQWVCKFDSFWCNKLLQRAAIINAAPWKIFGLGWLSGLILTLINWWKHLHPLSSICHAAINYYSADALRGLLTGWSLIKCLKIWVQWIKADFGQVNSKLMQRRCINDWQVGTLNSDRLVLTGRCWQLSVTVGA